jgi:hypothetical protein
MLQLQRERGNMNETQLAYMAGIIDGEGSVGLISFKQVCKAHGKVYTEATRGKVYGYYSRTVMRVGVGMTDEFIPSWLQAEFGGVLQHRLRSNPRWKDVWVWDVRATKALNFLKQVLPYLILKKGQAELCIAFQELRPTQGHALSDVQKQVDEILYQRCKELNLRGVKEIN